MLFLKTPFLITVKGYKVEDCAQIQSRQEAFTSENTFNSIKEINSNILINFLCAHLFNIGVRLDKEKKIIDKLFWLIKGQ